MTTAGSTKNVKKLKMIGSSIFEQWGTPGWGEIHVMNAAIGGTTAGFWALNINDHLSSEIWNYAVYCGSNDLNRSIPPSTIIKNTVAVLDAVRGKSKKHRVAYFSIMKAPQKNEIFEIIDQIHNAIRRELTPQDVFIDINSFINQDAKWYMDDHLHLTRACYEELEARLKDAINRWAV
jgi:lysophospholipase L1-like esterase